ncbi:MAG: hypothetical protein E5X34_27000 [Mesorhizobium sp.]|uniref:hypothetical protein n=1 Tax=Mesorhizobium sp. TaxID=1871066 RepID=UPI0011F7FF0E|nr:hypothetical protein [Mesorhizobium sp.]TIR15968.1 MAG: hypothetical protein E5X34_27000 [Mesorhizobium sp.]
MEPELRFEINLLADGSVVTKDGEYLGTWITDETDAFYEFTPEGASEATISSAFIGSLCKMIADWHDERPEG